MDLQRWIDWYADLAATPGWKEYVWHRVQEMAKASPSEFGDLPAALTAEMKARSASSSPSAPAADRTTASTGQPRPGA